MYGPLFCELNPFISTYERPFLLRVQRGQLSLKSLFIDETHHTDQTNRRTRCRLYVKYLLCCRIIELACAESPQLDETAGRDQRVDEMGSSEIN